MRNLTATDYIPMPWKSGGGSTRQLAISPPSASIDNFDWRISVAHAATDGPFSLFPGVDRSLILSHGTLSMEVDDGEAVTLTAGDEPFVFRGEQQIQATLPDGPIADFNVMTRRDRCTHALQMLRIDGELEFKQRADLMFIHVAQGHLRCGNATGEAVNCREGESLLLDRKESASIALSPESSALLYIARITFKDASHAQ
ncbi:HutD family protein [Noviherbaspirillum sp.]|jgi:hypothetical protein|uniref:HutD/Ves family protein n=1 Tax=Noviherbaspirillum sp. TaxID=1926288 RepID=UPI0025D4C487|nr:HutD family protein [Noviherbaspirillum sp.]